MLNISNFIDRSRTINLNSTDKIECLKQLSALLPDDLNIEKNLFYQKIIEREQDCSTGLGMGVAIPHARMSEIEKNTIIVGRSEQGIDFDSPDGAPVHIIFMIAVSTDQSQYMQIISRISWLVRNSELRSQLFRAESEDELYQLLSEH